MSARNPAVLGEWGPGGKRVEASESYWAKPLQWYRQVRKTGERRRVFCASLADVFDQEAPKRARRRLWSVIQETSGYLTGFAGGGLDWLILTKRPENIGDVLREDKIRPNFFRENRCWMGVSVESQEHTRRIWAVDHWGHITFVSAEPLLGPLDMPHALGWNCACGLIAIPSKPGPDADPCRYCHGVWRPPVVDWVVAGGESGPHARPMHPQWIRSLRDQCVASGVAFHFKQHGEWLAINDMPYELMLSDKSYRQISMLPDGRSGDQVTRQVCQELKTLPSVLYRVGKKNAGRLLDGRTWDEFPAPVAVA